ncbi:FAD-binding protein [Microbispora sp. ATCC PTA-5024]|uniref:FAD-binding protein n=1 Tax=Microbispora sp. ATCC PTA-5024 TaxID=316330 RepID=UPI0003DCDF74|nr:FAD-binding protein [Microbispora sp. ATCC PTA-5024]ETK36686.1 oxidoreductase [Microbispora sp. ATCC PTA-5024]
MVTRRRFLGTLGASALIVGFDPTTRAWATGAGSRSVQRIPHLDGVLLTDLPTRQADGRDLGRIVSRLPRAVLRPGSVRDVQKMIAFCREHRIPVATRGQGHSTHGQGLTDGLIIENRSLAAIHSVGADSISVDSGVLWREAAHAAAARGLTPPLFTTYVGLSVGGTLSVGGFPAQNELGLQIDHVRELDVVTGDGRLHRCSPDRERDLFEVMLGGLGQCGVITRATIDLVPARGLARNYLLQYPTTDTARVWADLHVLLERRELDGAYILMFAPDGKTVVYQLNGVVFYDAGRAPDDGRLLRGLSVPASSAAVVDSTYLEWVERYDRVIDGWRRQYAWDDLLKPWFDVILPGETAQGYVSEVVPTLTARDFGPPTGIGFVFPQRRSKLTRPFFRVPPGDSEFVYLFDVLTSSPAPGPDPAFAAEMLDRNRRLYDKARALGGTRYPIGSLDFTGDDWRAQYGERWPDLLRRKARYDPGRILTPGPGIFS